MRTITIPDRWGPPGSTVQLEVEIAYYGNGTLAIRLWEEGELYAVPTVNLQEQGDIPPPGHVHIKDYSESEGMAQALQDAGVVQLTGYTLNAGPYTATVREARLLEGWT